MTTFRKADETFLSNPDNRECDALAYACEALLWLKSQEAARPDWFDRVTPTFLAAVNAAVEMMAEEPALRAPKASELLSKVAVWRNDVADPSGHPLSQLGQVLDGNPGQFLEFGPLFHLTMGEILEGATHEYLTRLYPDGHDYRYTVALLCLAVLGVVAEGCFWATRGQGTNLRVEIGRALTGDPNALRGQLATLSLSGTALAWGEQVDFIAERGGPTPDFAIRRAERTLFVECTTAGKICRTTNNLDEIGKAIAHGWSEKRRKFERQEFRPGLVTIDLSGLPVDRAAGVLLMTDWVSKHERAVPGGGSLTFGINDARSDFEMMMHESFTRGVIAIAAAALNSGFAREHRILGIVAHYGQSVVVDTRRVSVHRPIRNTLFWGAEPEGPEFEMALRVALQPVSNVVLQHRMPPVFVHLV